jgi:hypothetical protein
MVPTGTVKAIHDNKCQMPVPVSAATSPKIVSAASNKGLPQSRIKGLLLIVILFNGSL